MTDREQLNIRLTADSADRMERIRAYLAERAGPGYRVTKTQILEDALIALESQLMPKADTRRGKK